MKKVCKILSIVLIFVLSLSGCGKNKDNNFQTGNLGVNNQSTWNIFNHPVTRGEGGYYYLASSSSDYVKNLVGKDNNIRTNYNIVMFMQDDGNSTVVCSKPDCRHNNNDCAACLTVIGEKLGDSSDGTITGYEDSKIYYYNGKIYVIYNDATKTGYTYLEEMSSNGSYRNRLFEIGSVSKGYVLIFKDDSVYISRREGNTNGFDENTATIRRRSLDGKEDEIIHSYTDVGATIFALKDYGDKLYFLEESYSAKKVENGLDVTFKRLGLFAYDYSTHNVEQVVDDNITDYTFDADNNTLYYYVYNKGLYKKDFNSRENKKIYDKEDGITEIAQVSYIDGKLYMTNSLYPAFMGTPAKEDKLYVLDRDGKELSDIDVKGIREIFFGCNGKIFMTGSMDKKYYIDISGDNISSKVQYN